MNSMSLICCLVAALSLLSSVVASDKCRARTPVPVDETWYLNKMPADGWFVTMQGECNEKEMKESTENSKKMSGGGDKSVCFSASIGQDGVAPADPLVYRCMYKNINEQLCTSSTPAGFQNPLLKMFAAILKDVKMTIVMTDDKTYVVVYCCVSGSIENWFVLSTTEDGPVEEENVKIREFVKTTKEEQKKSKGKGYTCSRFKMDKKCTGAAPAVPVDTPETPDLPAAPVDALPAPKFGSALGK